MPSMFEGRLHLQKQEVSLDDVNSWKTSLPTHLKNEKQRFGHIAGVAAKRTLYVKRKKIQEECKLQLEISSKKKGMLGLMMEHPHGEKEGAMANLEACMKKFHWLPRDKHDKTLIKLL